MARGICHLFFRLFYSQWASNKFNHKISSKLRCGMEMFTIPRRVCTHFLIAICMPTASVVYDDDYYYYVINIIIVSLSFCQRKFLLPFLLFHLLLLYLLCQTSVRIVHCWVLLCSATNLTFIIIIISKRVLTSEWRRIFPPNPLSVARTKQKNLSQKLRKKKKEEEV